MPSMYCILPSALVFDQAIANGMRSVFRMLCAAAYDKPAYELAGSFLSGCF